MKLPNGIPLEEGDAPDLFAACGRAAAQAGFKGKYHVFIDLSPAVFFVQQKVLGGLFSKDSFVIGLPVLDTVGRPEFDQLLAGALETRNGSAPRNAQQGASLAAASTMFQRYWMNDVNPLLRRGFVPPLLEGFERVRKRAGLPSPGDAAITMLRSPWVVERRLVAALGDTRGIGLQPVSWELVAWRVMLPSWEEEVKPHAAALQAIAAGDLAIWLQQRLLELGRKLTGAQRALPPEQMRWKAARTLSVALALTLHRNGWQIGYEGAGDAWDFRQGYRALNPFTTVDLLASRQMQEQEWVRLAAELGLVRTPLIGE